MNKLIILAKFVMFNFGPIIMFYAANHFYGLRVAVIASVIFTIGEILLYILSKNPITTFFKFSAGITILFGLVDLYLQKSVFFKYEAALSNVLVGIFFAATLFEKKSLIQEFAEAQGRIAGEVSPDNVHFFKFLTVIWALYSFAKAIFYFWVASRYTLEEGLAIRGAIGSTTFYGLLGISIFGAKYIKAMLASFQLLPSQKCSDK